MYNLFVTSQRGGWDDGTYVFSRDRVFEYTATLLKEKYSKLDNVAITALLTFPALFAYEAFVGAQARVGRLTEIRTRGREVRIKFTLNSALSAIEPEDLERLVWELDIGNLELNRTHWALKDEPLLRVLSEGGVISPAEGDIPVEPPVADEVPSVAVRPEVFRVPNQPIESDLTSVMMPFDTAFDPVYAAIQAACEDAGLRCQRSDDIWEDSQVIQDIFNLLYRSRVVVVDFSGRNPNVMYETGIAHTLGRTVVPLAQSPEHIPFDLRHHRYLLYLPNGEGLANMRTELAQRLKYLTA